MSGRRALVVLAIVLCASTAQASVFDIYGFDPRGMAMGGAMTAAVNDYSATYYNPAGLTVPKRIILSLGFTGSFPQLKIKRTFPNPDFPSQIPGFFSGITLGVLFPIGGPIKNKLAFGFALYFPTNKIIGVEGADPQFPQFYVYQRLPDKLNVLAAIAYEPIKYVSFGLGIQVLAKLFGDVGLTIDVLNDQLTNSNITVEVIPTANFTAGVLVRPFKALRLGFTYRAALALNFKLPAALKLGDPISLNLDISGTVLYTPHQFSFGASYHFEKPSITIAVDFLYALWSRAPDPSPQLKVDVGGTLVDGLGLSNAIDIGRSTPPIKMRFRNTLTYRIGIEYGPLKWLRVRAGYFYRPSPVPSQTQAYNYLDNDVHALSAGLSFTFANPLEVHRRPVSIDIAGQILLLPSKTSLKSDPLDPVGNLSYSGAVFTAAISLRHDF